MAHTGNIFFIGDTHFGHEKTCTEFKRNDGTPLRPYANADEMDDAMIKNWNRVVTPNDKVYHLGDVVISSKKMSLLNALNGKKRLVRGNHDIFETTEYLKYFDEVYGVRVLREKDIGFRLILSHIPLHRDSVVPRMGTNIHGHLHANDVEDGAYFNVSVENISYTPIALEDLRVRIKEKQKKYFNLKYSEGT